MVVEKDKNASALATVLTHNPELGMQIIQLVGAKKRAREVVKRLQEYGFDLSRPSGVFMKALLLSGYSPREAIQGYQALENIAINWFTAKEQVKRWRALTELEAQRLAEQVRHNKALESLRASEIAGLNAYRRGQLALQKQALAQDWAYKQAKLGLERQKLALMQLSATAGVGGGGVAGYGLKGFKTNTDMLKVMTDTYFDRSIKALDQQIQIYEKQMSQSLETGDVNTMKKLRVKLEALRSTRDLLIWQRQSVIQCVNKNPNLPSNVAFQECLNSAQQNLLKNVSDANSTIMAMYFTGKVNELGLNNSPEMQKLYAQELVRTASTYIPNPDFAKAMALAIQNSAQGYLSPKAVQQATSGQVVGLSVEQMKPDQFIKHPWLTKSAIQKNPNLFMQIESEGRTRYVLKVPVKGRYLVFDEEGRQVGSAKSLRRAMDIGWSNKPRTSLKEGLAVGGLAGLGAGAVWLLTKGKVRVKPQAVKQASKTTKKAIRVLTAGKKRKALKEGESVKRLPRERRALTRTAEKRLPATTVVRRGSKVILETSGEPISQTAGRPARKSLPVSRIIMPNTPEKAEVKRVIVPNQPKPYPRKIVEFKGSVVYQLPDGKIMIVKGKKKRIFPNITEAVKWLKGGK